MNDLHTTPSFKALDEGRLQPVDKGVTLKPCPFCGCRHATTASGQAEFDDEPDWATACAACHAEVWGNTEAEAMVVSQFEFGKGRAELEPAARVPILRIKGFDAESANQASGVVRLRITTRDARAVIRCAFIVNGLELTEGVP